MPVESVQAEVAAALEHINVPSYLIDTAGIIRWVNEAARRLVGDVEGRQLTSVVAHEDTRRAREQHARRVLGNTEPADSPFVLVDQTGRRVSVEISSVPLTRGDHVIGVFGQVSDLVEEPQAHPELRLTPRQAEILRELERGRTTAQIAEDLHLSRETVRNHIRHLLHAVGAHSRLEAVAVARGQPLATH
jgi:PAS domain S-box-containing protein